MTVRLQLEKVVKRIHAWMLVYAQTNCYSNTTKDQGTVHSYSCLFVASLCWNPLIVQWLAPNSQEDKSVTEIDMVLVGTSHFTFDVNLF